MPPTAAVPGFAGTLLPLSSIVRLGLPLKSQKEVLDPEVQAHYYRSWHVTAIHVCLTIERLRTKEAISESLGVPLSEVTRTLDFLTSVGLAEKRGNEFFTGSKVVFVGKDSPFLTHHGINWRHQAIRSIELNDQEDVHYSSVVSLTAKDAIRIRAMFLQAIADAREIWKNAKHEEELHSICLDMFRLSR